MPKNVQRTVRFPEELEPRIEAIARALSRSGYEASTTDALRFVITAGVASAENDLGIGIKASATKKGTAK